MLKLPQNHLEIKINQYSLTSSRFKNVPLKPKILSFCSNVSHSFDAQVKIPFGLITKKVFVS